MKMKRGTRWFFLLVGGGVACTVSGVALVLGREMGGEGLIIPVYTTFSRAHHVLCIFTFCSTSHVSQHPHSSLP